MMGASTAKLLLAALVLGCVTGCPPSDKRIVRTLPPPAYPPLRQTPQTSPPSPPPKPVSTNLSGKRVMIDPGHGGKDPGAWKGTRSRLPEKAIVLDIGNNVGRILQSRGAKVYATRTTDVYPSLDARAKAADRYKVDLFVSIHADSAPKNPAASGVEVHIQKNTRGKSLEAARCILAAVKKAGIEVRGWQSTNLHVLREHSRPAVLIECGFLTNHGDATKLNDSAYRARLAAAIADGITDYFSQH
ncbi:MAG TPA: N-acetylmuramoyl-L-alanine amidase [Phycisphaerae bacterium]|nr:N-acetylmuramoyl-L-alanine amidase [Phycisphaerae bacterium]